MRMIKEDEDEVLLDVSLEELRGSDTEINDRDKCMYVCRTKLAILLLI